MFARLKRQSAYLLLTGVMTVPPVQGWTAGAAKSEELPAPRLVAGSKAPPSASAAVLYKAMEAYRQDTQQPEYTRVQLAPLGGSVSLPRGWLLYEQHSPSGYRWTITMAAPSSRDRGEARMRVMFIPQVYQLQGMKPSVLAASQVNELTQDHPELRPCSPTRLGKFIKVCYALDMEADSVFEPKYHTTVSMYYSDELNLFAMTVFSAPPTKFSQYRTIEAQLDKIEFYSGYPQAPSAKKAGR